VRFSRKVVRNAVGKMLLERQKHTKSRRPQQGVHYK
jgi:hypothetical protein